MRNAPEGDARDARSWAAGPPTALAVGEEREVFQGPAMQQTEADLHRNVPHTNERRSRVSVFARTKAHERHATPILASIANASSARSSSSAKALGGEAKNCYKFWLFHGRISRLACQGMPEPVERGSVRPDCEMYRERCLTVGVVSALHLARFVV